MSVENPSAPYILLVHTNSYAGNFEREMCGFMTGIVGECEVGDGEAEKFREDMEAQGKDPDMFEDRLSHEADEHGCHRPASIWNAKGETGYNTVAIFFDDKPSDKEVELLKERAAQYGKDHKIAIKKLSLVKRKVKVTTEEIPI